MQVSDTLVDALGALFGGTVHKHSTNFSKKLTFKNYANISISAGQLNDDYNFNKVKKVRNFYDESYKIQKEKEDEEELLKRDKENINYKKE